MKRGTTRDSRGISPARRALLNGLAALGAANLAPGAGVLAGLAAGDALAADGAATLARPQFDALCATLAGARYAERRIADALVAALSSTVGAGALRRVAALAASTPPAGLDAALSRAGLAAAAETIVAALATGTVDTPKGLRVITYDNALIWQALPWTKPNAYCGGQVDYWSTAPAGVKS